MPSEPSAHEVPPSSDEDIGRVTVGQVTLHNAPITLAAYDLRWPEMFAREASRIRSALESLAIRIEHVGSTSVPGLAAKPIIDIVVEVPDSADEAAYLPALEAAGYVLRIREPDWFEHRLLKGPDTYVNVHVFSTGATEIEQMILFRDWLRSHDDERDAYLAVKRDLAERTWRHVQHYADAKTAIVQQILARAAAERKPSTSQFPN
ncbi:MAG: GrpB family protein [Actinobacteria bacterium]|nr:GrpB family protein [Actinomycetota bacterium]